MRFPGTLVRPICCLIGISSFLIYAADAPPLTLLTQAIPAQPMQRLTGSQFAASLQGMDSRQREQAVLQQLLAGNLPSFLRRLTPVKLSYEPVGKKPVLATVFVMPEYLAVGSDQDFLRVPMNLYTASQVASRLGFVLPTRKIVDAIYRQSAFHFSPQPMTPGPQMSSTGYYRRHNEEIDEQARMLGIQPGVLVSGHKKDVVLTNRLDLNPGRIAIYGWHKSDGSPIQPLSTVHGACYEDYSHGIRLVSETALINGQPRSIYEVLNDPEVAPVLSDEGPIRHVRDFMTQTAGDSSCARLTWAD